MALSIWSFDVRGCDVELVKQTYAVGKSLGAYICFNTKAVTNFVMSCEALKGMSNYPNKASLRSDTSQINKMGAFERTDIYVMLQNKR